MDYLRNEYLFVGSVNRQSRDFFRKINNTVTNVSSCFESVAKLEWSGLLDTSDKKNNYINLEPYVYSSRSTDVLQYVEDHRIVYSINGALEHAIRRRDLDMIDWLEGRFEMHGPACMIAAVESGSLDMVKRYCVENLLNCGAENFFPAGAHVYDLRERDRMIICREWRAYVGDYLVEAAKYGGYFEILRWLYSQGIPDPKECQGVVGDAVNTCSREMVEWMLDHGYKMTFDELSTEMGIHQGDYMRCLRDMCA